MCEGSTQVRAWALIGAVCAVSLMPSVAVAQARFAILIGANAGWANDRPLRHAERDADRMYQALVEVGGFEPERVLLLRDPDAAEVRAQLRRFSERARLAGPDSMVFFYYSGHADKQALHLRGLPFTWGELVSSLSDLPAGVRLGVVDACQSGSVLFKGGAPIASFEVRAQEPVRGFALLSSSGADELSQETRALQGSVFTHHFVSGLKGAADLDRDGKVTLNEVYRYSYERTEADTAPTAVPQRPAFRVELKGQGELVLSTLTSAAAGLVLPKASPQRYVVTDALEWRLVAEAVSSPDAETVLALKAGDYKLKRLLGDTLEVASLSLKGGRISAASLRFEPQPVSRGVVKGRPAAGDTEELLEYRRTEALGLLDRGDAYAARVIFDELLAEHPDDLGAQRGKARALVREAESWERVGDHTYELQALKGALHLEPTLAEDPDFARWYRRIAQLDAEQGRQAVIEKAAEQEVAVNPRLKRRFGVTLEGFGGRGLLMVAGHVMLLERHLFVSFGIAAIGPGVDLSVKYVPFGFKWSPYVQVGGHYNLRRLWDPPDPTYLYGPTENVFHADDMWSTTGHADVGVQFFAGNGFCLEFGLSFMLFPRRPDAQLQLVLMPSFALGFYF